MLNVGMGAHLLQNTIVNHVLTDVHSIDDRDFFGDEDLAVSLA